MKDKLQSRRQYLQNTDLKQNGIQNMQTPQENKQPNLKISRRSGVERPGLHSDGKYTYEKMLHITDHQAIVN